MTDMRGEAVDAGGGGNEKRVDSRGEGTSTGPGWRVATNGMDLAVLIVDVEKRFFAGLRVRLPFGAR
jgi:hypothetical protein